MGHRDMMKPVVRVLNQMVQDGIIGNYAVAGAVAAFNYIEAVHTEDLDILAAIGSGSSLITMEPIYRYLADKGYSEAKSEGLMIEGWLVQFLPAYDALTVEALANAEEFPYRDAGDTGTPEQIRVIQAEHVMAFALSVGRTKDHLRLAQFIEEGKVKPGPLKDVLERHGLLSKWRAFVLRFSLTDPIP